MMNYLWEEFVSAFEKKRYIMTHGFGLVIKNESHLASSRIILGNFWTIMPKNNLKGKSYIIYESRSGVVLHHIHVWL
jgi:hypothetical protein